MDVATIAITAVNAANILASVALPGWLLHLAAGIPGGALFTAAWSLWTKRRERKSLARAIRIELTANVSYLIDTLLDMHSGAVPFSLQLGTLLYRSIANRLGDLPPELVSRVVLVYRDFELLDSAVDRYHYLCEEQLKSASGLERELFREAEAIRQQLPINIQKTIENAHAAVAKLLEEGRERDIRLPPLPNASGQTH